MYRSGHPCLPKLPWTKIFPPDRIQPSQSEHSSWWSWLLILLHSSATVISVCWNGCKFLWIPGIASFPQIYIQKHGLASIVPIYAWYVGLHYHCTISSRL
jgi:hypothetical protein